MHHEEASLMSSEALDNRTPGKADLDHLPRAVMIFLSLYDSRNTQETYARAIKDFFSLLAKSGLCVTRMSEIREEHVILFSRHLRRGSEGYSRASIQTKMAAISAFLEFGLKKRLIPENPVRFLVQARGKLQADASQTRRTPPLHPDELSKMLRILISRTENPAATENEARRAWLERSIFQVLSSTGARASEVAALRIRDFRPSSDDGRRPPAIRFEIKGGTERWLPIPDDLESSLSTFIATFRAKAAASEHIFVARSGGESGVTRDYITRLVQRLAKQADVERRVCAHSVRVGVATTMASLGVPMPDIRDVLGHASVSTTDGYLRSSRESVLRSFGDGLLAEWTRKHKQNKDGGRT